MTKKPEIDLDNEKTWPWYIQWFLPGWFKARMKLAAMRTRAQNDLNASVVELFTGLKGSHEWPDEAIIEIASVAEDTEWLLDLLEVYYSLLQLQALDNPGGVAEKRLEWLRSKASRTAEGNPLQ